MFQIVLYVCLVKLYYACITETVIIYIFWTIKLLFKK